VHKVSFHYTVFIGIPSTGVILYNIQYTVYYTVYLLMTGYQYARNM